MSSIRKAFLHLQEQWQHYDEDQDPSGQLYQAIRTDLLELIETARDDLYREEYLAFKKDVINYLCRICGHQRDKDVLERFSPGVLSREELAFIVANSALKRLL